MSRDVWGAKWTLIIGIMTIGNVGWGDSSPIPLVCRKSRWRC
jgi:hypothetical protein